MLAVKDRSNVVRAVCERYADRFGVDLQGPACMAEIYGHEFADWAHAEDELALRLGLSVSLTPSTSGPVKTLRAPLDGDLLQVRVTDAAEDLDALLAIRWPELGDEARRVLWAVTGWASPSGVSQVGDLEQLAARAGIAEPRTARLLLELAQRGALGISGGEAEAIWLPSLLRGEVLSEPQERLVGVQRGLEALTAAVEGLASGGRLLGVGKASKRYKVTARPPKGRDGRYWQLRIFSPDGTQKQQSARPATTQLEAESMARAKERELNGDEPALAEVLRLFLAWRAQSKGSSKRTQETYGQRARKIAALSAGLSVDRAGMLKLQDALSWKLAARTVNQHMTLARAAWEWALAREIVSDPWPSGIERLPEKETKLRPCTPAELDAILGALLAYEGGHYYPIACMLSDAGSRITETAALQERHVDRVAGTVRFESAKGGKTRTVCVSSEVLELLDPAADWCFPSRSDPSRPMHRHSFYHAFRQALATCGLDGEPLSPHSLRRSWITDSLREGVAIGQSMLQTGHTTTAIHLAYRRNAPNEGQREAHRRVTKSRSPYPHTTPQTCGGRVLKHRSDQGGEDLSRSGCSGLEDTTAVGRGLCAHDRPHTAKQMLVARLGEGATDSRGEPSTCARTAIQTLRAMLRLKPGR